MPKYTLRSKRNGIITYVYRTGFKVSVKPDYPKFLRDVIKYAGVKAEDIDSYDDLVNLFDKAKRRNANFNESEDSKTAIKRQWELEGRTFRLPKERRQEYLQRELRKEKNPEDIKKIERKIIRVRERGHIVKYEEYRVLFKWAFQ